MILKTFEVDKLDIKKINFFLFYGVNQGYKSEIIEKKFKGDNSENIYRYEESEILNNEENFLNDILTKSFFENEKIIIISRATDKIKNLIEKIILKRIEDLTIVLNSNSLEKKSKLRSFFEKNKETICVPFYEDNNQTLSGMASKFFRENQISISQQAINLITERCRGDRQNLNNELQKLKSFTKNKNKIEIEDLLKLTNLAENYNVSELIDITRTFLMKSKRLLKICQEFKETKNIDTAISEFRPPIFWKDKETVKQQVKNWSPNNTENLIYKINEIELLVKKNSSNSLNILSNFIIEQATIVSN